MLSTLRTRTVSSPLDLLLDMRRQVDSMVGGWNEGVTDAPVFRIPADVVETDNQIRFQLEVPGMKPEDVSVTLENGVLTISGEKKVEQEEGEGEYRLFERRYGRFERSFRVPQNIVQDDVSARYDNGLLLVTLPKAEEAKPRRI
ncbi:MAG TPA: Hsp20/alpha crystallin family protein, partial [Longimicrobiales bacterium]|nr:Hsp20/alpha crystallin family protein [Longimicrobiales bacterium]